MKLYNTLSRQKENFSPGEKNEVKIYACGPTVYNYIHIGNARPICVFDVMRRFMEYVGWKVTFVQNFTDIDDKIIRRANEENSDYLAVSQKYIKEYKKDAKGLNVREATYYPLATENIDEIIDIICALIEKGFAYVVDNGDVYFRTKRFKKYGKLSHQPLEDLEAGARIEIGDFKEDPMDFALWKAAKPGEPMWKSPWGNGRPGWHIECSAMARKYLGKTIDIHCGGQDLIFPHHENEIAQSECANECEFSRFWIHNGYINVDNKKMSKSLNNFFTVRDVANLYGYEPIRYLMIASHYRSPINYSEDIIKQCQSALNRLYTCRRNLTFAISSAPDQKIENEREILDSLNAYREKFIEKMNDDLNTADAIGVLFDLVRDINSKVVSEQQLSKFACEQCLKLFDELTDILGIIKKDDSEDLDVKVKQLIDARSEARAKKDWETADKIRDQLQEMNIILEDTPQGIKWHKA